MKRIFLTSCLVVALSHCLFAQAAKLSNIQEVKKELESLQEQMFQVDSDSIDVRKSNEIEKLRASLESKDEFETTKQFEARQVTDQKRIERLREEIESQVKERQDTLQRKINEILAVEFELPLESRRLMLGVYDADKQQFPLFFNSEQWDKLFVPLADAKDFKEGFFRASKIGRIGLSLDEKNQAKEYLIQATVTLENKVYRTATKELTNENAMRIIYGNFDSSKQTSYWTSQSKAVLERRDTEKLESVPGTFRSLLINGDEKLLFYAKEPNENSMGCHACGRIFSYAIFTKSDSRWKVESVIKDAGEYGSWGTLGEPKVVKIGIDKYAFKFSWGSAKQFYDFYFDITDVRLRYLFDVELGGDLAFLGENLKVNVTFLPSEKSYFDARVTTIGKKYYEKVGKAKPISKVEVYAYNGNTYQVIKK